VDLEVHVDRGGGSGGFLKPFESVGKPLARLVAGSARRGGVARPVLGVGRVERRARRSGSGGLACSGRRGVAQEQKRPPRLIAWGPSG